MPFGHKDHPRITCYCLLLLALHCPVQLGRDGDDGHVAQAGPVHLLHAAVARPRSPVHTARVADLGLKARIRSNMLFLIILVGFVIN